MTKPCMYSEILHTIADGKDIQFKQSNGDFVNIDKRRVLYTISQDDWESPKYEFRVKPSTIIINGIEVPYPETKALHHEPMFYIPNLAQPDNPQNLRWFGDDDDFKWLAAGLVHLEKSAAVLHAKALLSFTAT